MELNRDIMPGILCSRIDGDPSFVDEAAEGAVHLADTWAKAVLHVL